MAKKFASTIAGASILITIVGLLSKGFGFVREIVFANNFGLQSMFDAYLIGSVLPITINSSIVYLAQNYFIPAYHRKILSGQEKGREYFSINFWFFIVISLLIALILYIISPSIINSYVNNHESQISETVLLVFRIFIITIPINSANAILSAYYQAEFNFKTPTYSTLFPNIATIIFVLFFTNDVGIYTIPIGYLLGTILQLFYLTYSYKQKVISFASIWKSKRWDKKFTDYSLLLIIIIELVNQLYLIVDRYFYGSIDEGGLATLNYAMVIYLLPISIFSFALSSALFPGFAKSISTESKDVIEAQYVSGLRMNLLIFIPITIIFFVWGDSIIRTFYERGNFTFEDSYLTYDVLKLYSLSLLFFSSYAIINKIIYSAGLIKSLLLISIFVFLVKISLNVMLVKELKQEGLAISTSISYILISLSCFVLSIKRLKLKILSRISRGFLLFGLNAGLSYLIVRIFRFSDNYSDLQSFMIMIMLFCGVYTINIFIVKSEEYFMLKKIIERYV
jgi:putative peptidoglycan lipid II flippase